MKNRFSSQASLSSLSSRLRKPVTSLAALTLAFGVVTEGCASSAVKTSAGAPTSKVAAATTLADVDSSDPLANVLSPLPIGGHLVRHDDLVVTQSFPSVPEQRWITTFPTQSNVNTQCPFNDPGCQYVYGVTPAMNPQTALVGRFFNTKSDTIIQVPGGTPDGGNWTADILGGNDTGGYQTSTWQALPAGMMNATTIVRSGVGDFNGDGYDDLVVFYLDTSLSEQHLKARMATAADPSNPSAGLTWGPEQTFGVMGTPRSVAVGDFNVDGKPEAAVLTLVGGYPRITVFSVDANQNFTGQAANQLGDPLPDTSLEAPMQLLAGTFVPGGGQQLVFAANQGSANNKLKVRIYAFTDSSLKYFPVEEGNYVTEAVTNMKLAVGRFDWSSPVDTLAVMSTNANGKNSTSYVDIVNVDPVNFIPTVTSSINVPSLYNSSDKNYVALDIAVGNFGNADYGVNQDEYNPLPDEQIAIAVGYCNGQYSNGLNQFKAEDVYTMNVTAAGETYWFGNSRLSDSNGKQESNVTHLNIEAADLQGLSQRLGAGYRITIDKTSPTMMLAAPPAHVDYVKDVLGTLTVMNESLAPSGFNANYQTSTGTQLNDSETSSNGWTFGVQQGLDASMCWGNKANNVTVTASFKAMEDWSGKTDKAYGTQVSMNQQFSTTTGTSDVMLWGDGVTYLWIYPIVGQTACPEGQDTCDDSAKVPLTVAFSKPGPQQQALAAVDDQFWYQPVWENGNVLSYPGNQQQLFNGANNLLTINQQTQLFTDRSTVQSTTTWSGNQSQSSNVSSSFTNKEDLSLSVGGTLTFPLTGQAKASISADVNHSGITESMSARSASISASSTLGIAHSASFNNQYGFTPVILGQNVPPNYFEASDPNRDWTQPISSNGITTFGPSRTAFTVDPLSGTANSAWWKQTYGPTNTDGSPGAFDIAFNHPLRWHTKSIGTNLPIPSNCVALAGTTGYADCAFPNPRTPETPAADDFHAMRGFFVFNTPADPSITTTPSMQMQLATQGDQLTLEARVYNYSLNPMPAGTKVHVNFYAMPWNQASGLPANANGESTFIGQYTVNSIQPFNTDTANPNFVLASVPFDTTSFSGAYAFWTVAWAEDANGNLIGELPGKGLTSSPGTLAKTSTNYADFVALEPTMDNAWIDDPSRDSPTISFSNNIGFFENIFQIMPKPSAAQAGVSATHTSPRLGDITALTVPTFELKRLEIKQGDLAELKTTVSNSGEPMQIATAYFYDGDPDQGGKVVAARRLPYLETGATNAVEAHYRPTTCGVHDIYTKVVHRGLATAKVKALESITVDCDAPDGGTGSSSSSSSSGAPAPDGGSSSGGGENGAAPTGDDGGCNMNGRQAGGAATWLAALGAVVMGAFRRRKKTV